MCVRNRCLKMVFLLLLILNVANAVPASSPEINAKASKFNNNNISLQQQQQMLRNIQDTQLNSLNVYAANYDIISNKHIQSDHFKPSYKLSEMETNFTPIQNGNTIASSSMDSQTPVLMQYMPQTINENGVQYLQLIPTRPLMVPIGPYLAGNTGVQSLSYQQHLTPSNSIEYGTRPILSTLPVNIPPPAPSPLIEVATLNVPSYGIQSYSNNISPYKQNRRINRETTDKQLLGPLSLNINEYIPQSTSQHNSIVNIQERS